MRNQIHIISTIGPTMEKIVDLDHAIKAGTDCFRIHLGYRNRNHKEDILKIVKAFRNCKQKACIMLDFPSLRPRISPNAKPIYIKKNDTISLCNAKYPVNNAIPVDNLRINKNMMGKVIKFLDGKIEGKILSIDDEEKSLSIKITQGSEELKPNNSIIIINDSNIYKLLSKYELDIIYFLKNNVVNHNVRLIFALSMIMDSAQIKSFRKKVNPILDINLDIISKIETVSAIKNITSILQHSSIMIARGDLLLNIDYTDLPNIQEYLVDQAHQEKRKVFLATQLIENYAENCIPHRSEIIDLWNAYKQKVSGIVLCKETAYSSNPISAIKFCSHFFKKQEKTKKSTLNNCILKGQLGKVWLDIMTKIINVDYHVEDFKEIMNAQLVITYDENDALLNNIIKSSSWLVENIIEMKKVFFSKDRTNKFNHSYASLMQSYKGEKTVSPIEEIINQLENKKTTRQALITVIPDGEKVPCINTIHFMNRNNELYVIYYSRGQDMLNKFIPDFFCVLEMAHKIISKTQISKLKSITANIGSAHIYKQDFVKVNDIIRNYGKIK